MADSGARGSNQQIKQLAGMRGLMADTTGRTIELPIKSNFREGLEVLEYFMSAHGARKGLSDTALRTADSGYLTRRLVDVSQDLIIREMTAVKTEQRFRVCGSKASWTEKKKSRAFRNVSQVVSPVRQIKIKRWKIIVKANHMITPKRAARIMKEGVKPEQADRSTNVKIRTILSCKCKVGVCAKCYGANMATGEAVTGW